MHIEPGLIIPAKLAVANVAAVAVTAYYASKVITQPVQWLRTALAAIFFSIFMQAFHMPVGPSELHFIGAIAMYLTLGFVPTLLGFAFGLLLQGVLFDMHDLPHLAINSLSLIVPLIMVHATWGKRLLSQGVMSLRWSQVVRLDALYYGGVTVMVGFWLSVANVSTPFADWAMFASSYAALVLCEPLLTLGVLTILQRHSHRSWLQYCFAAVNMKRRAC